MRLTELLKTLPNGIHHIHVYHPRTRIYTRQVSGIFAPAWEEMLRVEKTEDTFFESIDVCGNYLHTLEDDYIGSWEIEDFDTNDEGEIAKVSTLKEYLKFNKNKWKKELKETNASIKSLKEELEDLETYAKLRESWLEVK